MRPACAEVPALARLRNASPARNNYPAPDSTGHVAAMELLFSFLFWVKKIEFPAQYFATPPIERTQATLEDLQKQGQYFQFSGRSK